ncbi:hypothetical protein J7348_10090 [Qipengyuania flava]|uniref:hypothetical protein n=1 Tax=Qipengyuania flava TaxID=192812 RepID=UPI001ADCD559|nr:hypothetical protein [Qipengyuania flava]MBO9504974.1 hypothetical protein [Qipengyuania flava]
MLFEPASAGSSSLDVQQAAPAAGGRSPLPRLRLGIIAIRNFTAQVLFAISERQGRLAARRGP